MHIWREHKKNPNPKNPSLPNQLVAPTWQNKKSSRTPSGFGIFFFLGRSLSPATISFSQSLPLSPAKPFLAHRAFLPKPAPPPSAKENQKAKASSPLCHCSLSPCFPFHFPPQTDFYFLPISFCPHPAGLTFFSLYSHRPPQRPDRPRVVPLHSPLLLAVSVSSSPASLSRPEADPPASTRTRLDL